MRKSIEILIISLFLLLSPYFLSTSQAMQDRALMLKQMKTEKRVALVIGNSSYKDAPLRNPVNDARAMSKALKSLGFTVISGENLSQRKMKKLIDKFGRKIRNGGVGLFYYAGHGMQVDGINYLIPVSAKVYSEEDVEFESVNAKTQII